MSNKIDKPLTARELKFASLVAKGYTLSKAYRLSHPHKSDLAPSTIRRNASNLATKSNILSEVATRVETEARLARQAEERIEEILVEGDIHTKDNKVADVAMWAYEQANGKATQKIQMESKHVNINFNLSGSDEPVPQEVLDALAVEDKE